MDLGYVVCFAKRVANDIGPHISSAQCSAAMLAIVCLRKNMLPDQLLICVHANLKTHRHLNTTRSCRHSATNTEHEVDGAAVFDATIF